MNRKDFFDSHSTGRSTITKEEQRVILDRLTKKYLRDKGFIGPKIPKRWQIDIGDSKKLEVIAYTRSEARALIKKEMGVKKLPIGLKIERVEYESTIR